MSNTFLGINLDVSEVSVVLVDSGQRMLAHAAVRLPQFPPVAGWAEQSPEEWWHATLEAIAGVRAEMPAAFSHLRAIAVSGQTQGTVLLDKHHRLLRPAILSSDRRTRAECIELETLVATSRSITGSVALPGFTAPNLLWLQKYERSVFDNIAKVLTPKDYIVFRLTGEFVTDMSDASSTLCLDVRQRDWSDRIIEAVMLARNHFPRLAEGSEVAGILRTPLGKGWRLAHPVPVAVGAAYPAATSVGLGMQEEGSAYVSLGSSGLAFATTNEERPGPDYAVRSVGHCLPKLWHQLGVLPAAMASLDWWARLRETDDSRFGLDQVNVVEMLDAPMFLPYLNGASTPRTGAHASGVFFGLTENTDRRSLSYAILEGVAFCMADSLSAIKKTGTRIERASLIGEGARSRLWAELLVSACRMPLDLHAPEFDAAAVGAARLARLAAGDCTVRDVCVVPPIVETVLPRADWHQDLEVRHARFQRLNEALKAEFAIQGIVP